MTPRTTLSALLAGAAALAALPAAAEQHTMDPSQEPVVLAPATQAFIDGLEGSTPINELPPEEARQVLVDAQTGVDVAMPDAEVSEMSLPVGPSGNVDVTLVRPAGSEGETLPGVVYFHGGGWVLGNFTTHERLMRDLANASGAAFVFVEYDPAPEAKHPTQLEQDYAVLEYVAANGAEFGIDPERIATAGDSVGGQMVAVMAMMAEERNGPEIDAQVMFYPVTTASLDSESYDLFSDGPWLTKAAMAWFWENYLPEDADAADPMISPLNASIEQLAGFPPTLVITDENDVLRDEGEAFAAKMVEAGVSVEGTRYLHTIHDFAMLNAIADTPAPKAAIEQAAGFLRHHLAEGMHD
ncbi:alpha/beta hydrolase [Jannaschia sp. W003]|uniref:alpha/beta hydrolase n=1 Tax=Jannaschia sp. W003 TaxID=2867012 RepID=UPI0021A7EE53|nr:alpha/beta hydrolase [Jannaschia sp. W003]UWQ21668.1 alpha/beta hydrolase [Jannaschia sp. W003]